MGRFKSVLGFFVACCIIQEHIPPNLPYGVSVEETEYENSYIYEY